MDLRDLTKLLIKIAAAVLIFWYMSWLPAGLVAVSQSQNLLQGLAVNILPVLIPLALAVIVFLFPTAIANKLIGPSVTTNAQGLSEQLQIISLRTIGCFYLFRGAVDFSYYLGKVYFRARVDIPYGNGGSLVWLPDDLASIFSTVVELCIALFLALRATSIVGYLSQESVRTELLVEDEAISEK